MHVANNNHDLADIVTTKYRLHLLVQKAVNNNHDLADIVTTEHLLQKSPAFISFCCSDSLTDVLRVVSCKVCFGLKLLVQLAS